MAGEARVAKWVTDDGNGTNRNPPPQPAPLLPDLRAVLAADTVETWKGGFEHFQISGQTDWTAPDTVIPGHIPVTANWKFTYKQDPEILTLESALFETPQSRIQASGTLGPSSTSSM